MKSRIKTVGLFLLMLGYYVVTNAQFVYNNCGSNRWYALSDGGSCGVLGPATLTTGGNWNPVSDWNYTIGPSPFKTWIKIHGDGNYHGSSPADYCGPSFTVTNGYTINVCDINCTNSFTFKVKNTDSVGHYYQLLRASDGEHLAGSTTVGQTTFVYIPAGGQGVLGYRGCEFSSPSEITVAMVTGDWKLVVEDVEGQNAYHIEPGDNGYESIVPSNQYLADVATGTGTYPTISTNAPGFNATTTAVYNSTNLPIVFTGTNNTEMGFSALYDAITKGTAQATLDAGKIVTAVNGVTNAIGASTLTLSNAIGSGASWITNALARIQGTGTNLNLSGLPGGIATNQSTAESLAGSYVSDVEGDISGMSDDFASGLAGETYGSGGGSPVSIPLGSFTMTASLMPDDWGDVWDFACVLFRWILWAAFLVKVAKEIRIALFEIMNSEASQVPNLQGTFLGVGGNVGITMMPVLIVGMLAVYAATIAAAVQFVAGNVTSAGLAAIAGGPFAGASGAVINGIYFLCKAVPFDTIVTLAITYAIIILGMAKMVTVCKITMKFFVK